MTFAPKICVLAECHADAPYLVWLGDTEHPGPILSLCAQHAKMATTPGYHIVEVQENGNSASPKFFLHPPQSQV